MLFALETLTPLPKVIQADEKRLRQVLINLLNNAIKFTDQGGVTLWVAVIETEEQIPAGQSPPPGDVVKIRFEVVDAGVGMTPEQLGKIFQPFEQVGRDKQKEEGTGLGLVISRQLVELMGSALQVKSEADKGSTFWFDLELPLGTAGVGLRPRQTGGRILGYKGRPRKVLIVDDKSYNRSVLTHLLMPLGFEIIEASEGREAIEKTREARPEIVLMDLVMPGMTGFEATQTIRQGIGMSETDQAKLFRIGENYSKLGTEREQGSGLGLIICQEMVQRQGGRIWVESDGVPGQGTVVNFTMPADQTAR